MTPRLMIPGPTDVSEDVLEVMGEPVRAHYGADWVVLHSETIAMLSQIIGTTGKIFMIPGSGSAANDGGAEQRRCATAKRSSSARTAISASG